MSNMKKLDALFNLARLSEPVLDIDYVRLRVIDPHFTKPKLPDPFRMLLTGSIVVVVIAGAFFMFKNGERTIQYQSLEPIVALDSTAKDTFDVFEMPATYTDKSITGNSQKDTVNTFSIFGLDEEKPESVNTISTSESTGNLSAQPTNDEVAEEDLEYITLEYDELENLGIYTDGKKLEYHNVTAVSDTMMFHYSIKWKGSVASAGNKATSDEISNSKKTKVYGISMLAGDDDMHRAIAPFYRLAEIKNMLVPVLVHMKKPLDKEYDREGKLLFWFRPDSALLDALPADARGIALKKLRSFDPTQMGDVHVQHRLKEVRAFAGATLSAAGMQQVYQRWVRLSPPDLKKLHLSFTNGEMVFENKSMRNGKPYAMHLSISSRSYKLDEHTGTIPGPGHLLGDHLFPYASSDSAMKNIQIYGGPDKFVKEDKMKVDFIDSISFYTPVVFQLNKGDTDAATMLLWFRDNEALRKALPASKEVNAVKSPESAESTSLNVTDLHIVKAGKATLQKLGITINKENTRVKVLTSLGTKAWMSEFSADHFGKKKIIPAFISEGEQLWILGADTCYAVSKSEETLPGPALISNKAGKLLQFKNDKEAERKYIQSLTVAERKSLPEYSGHIDIKRIRTYIPVEVHFENTGEEEDLILWYEPTKEFIAKLPVGDRVQMQQELDIIEAGKTPLTCRYFDACQWKSGALLGASIYPNPVEGNTMHVEIELSEAREFTFNITDFSGKLLHRLKSSHADAGKSVVDFNFDTINEGLFLLVIESDKGERITQRFIKR